MLSCLNRSGRNPNEKFQNFLCQPNPCVVSLSMMLLHCNFVCRSICTQTCCSIWLDHHGWWVALMVWILDSHTSLTFAQQEWMMLVIAKWMLCQETRHLAIMKVMHCHLWIIINHCAIIAINMASFLMCFLLSFKNWLNCGKHFAEVSAPIICCQVRMSSDLEVEILAATLDGVNNWEEKLVTLVLPFFQFSDAQHHHNHICDVDITISLC